LLKHAMPDRSATIVKRLRYGFLGTSAWAGWLTCVQ